MKKLKFGIKVTQNGKKKNREMIQGKMHKTKIKNRNEKII